MRIDSWTNTPDGVRHSLVCEIYYVSLVIFVVLYFVCDVRFVMWDL